MDPSPLLPKPLPQSFFADEATAVARRLVGCLLCRRFEGELLVGRIVETEAYLPHGDGAAHQLRARSPATESLYGEAGTAYIHRLRQHHLLDVVTREPHQPAGAEPGGAVLLRALEPLAGLGTMAARRGGADLHRLAAGPGRLCQALAIDLAFNGATLAAPAAAKSAGFPSWPTLFIAAPPLAGAVPIVACRRIGIRAAAELPLRFLAAGSPFLSRRAADS